MSGVTVKPRGCWFSASLWRDRYWCEMLLKTNKKHYISAY